MKPVLFYQNSLFAFLLLVSTVCMGQLNVNIVATDVLCAATATGTADAQVTGGMLPYAYNWNNGQTNSIATGLIVGSYNITITDALGATISATTAINEPIPLVIDSISILEDTCRGNAIVLVSGGTPPYTFSWSHSSFLNDSIAHNLSNGNYSVTVTDANGCFTSSTFNISQVQGQPLTGYIASFPALCYGSNSGQLGAVVQGGVGSYSYLWSTTPNKMTVVADTLAAGTYTVSITDSRGCVFIMTDTLGQASELQAGISIVQTIACFGGMNGIASIDSTWGGTPGYSYSWGTNPIQNTLIATGLAAGISMVTVIDDNGCIDSFSVTLAAPDSVTVISQITNTTCDGRSDGRINIVSSNATIISYEWDGPLGQQLGNPNSNLIEGWYQLSSTSNQGCQDTFDFYVSDPEIEISTSAESCHNAIDGSATADVSSPLSNLSYQWSSSFVGVIISTSQTVTGLLGNYTSDINNPNFYYIVTVTDTTGCVWIDSVYVYSPDSLNLFILDNNNGTASGNPTGGLAPYSYQWSSNTGNQTTATATGLAANVQYFLTVRDSLGCYVSDSLTLTVGLDQIGEIERFVVYPNPNSQGNFYVDLQFQKEQAGYLVLCDVFGRTIQQVAFEKNSIQQQINCKNLEGGVYVLFVKVDGVIVSRKTLLLKN